MGVIVNNLIDDANFAMKGDCTARRGHQLISAMGNVVTRTSRPIVARAMHPDTRYYFGPDHIFNGKTFESVAAIWESQIYMPFAPGVPEGNRATEPPVTVPGYTVKPAADVEEWVLATAGARPADRDPVDARVVNDVKDGTGTIIASQEDVGGWPELEENRRELELPATGRGLPRRTST
ncbi:MAG: hypothetical protein HQ567_14825 [Candidatus Nealsonbacteria bacterium]|nr:hypothetical protein [Candidatus Nealsonbacteria bacterium]